MTAEAARVEAAQQARTAEAVPVDRALSVSVAGFAALLAVGLVLGAQGIGLGAGRLPYVAVILGVQLLFILASTMAMRPPAMPAVAGVSVLVALGADLAAVLPDEASLAKLGLVAAAGFGLSVLAQLLRPSDRERVTESLGATLMIVIGVVAFATLVVLTRKPGGTQTLTLCLTAAGVALVVARLVDPVSASPRLAPQVPRGALGVVLGAMLGTAAGAVLGSSLVAPFTPTNGAVLGLLCACAAVLTDLGANYAEAGRLMAGDPPTFWIARHMQGPIAGLALAAPVAYVGNVLFLVPFGGV
ncbi:hypothetical protein GCM10010124_22960 [Pilimelia terevasa]|uniref:Uncharacterized protein n=1 Tax=Pilimelia terevasa TaxID=53372 RepID=A0A8J3FIG8_9ACTN|nr:hypothetical protein [Pilimelia terevasa]GGK29655.1 hypothetical protein GCM10010124_22960 [Pilimelia terevasa]